MHDIWHKAWFERFEKMAKQQRGNDYLLQRLKKDAPAIYADLQAGEYPSVRAAAIAAGLRKPTRQINLLKNAWRKADAKDRSDFLAWIGAVPSTTPPNKPIVDSNSRLLPKSKARIEYIMLKRGIKLGQVMREMGLNPRDASLGAALRNATSLRRDIVLELEKWLDKNKSV